MEFAAALEEGRVRDRQTGFTQAGPHRADLLVRMDGHRVEERASRGQQKLVAAGLVLAEAACLRDSGAQKGILLLDDPAAELDKRAVERLILEVDRLPVQCVFTAIHPSAVSIGDGALFHVEQGRVQPMV
jgi:DNA replication and repair protein RecF